MNNADRAILKLGQDFAIQRNGVIVSVEKGIMSMQSEQKIDFQSTANLIENDILINQLDEQKFKVVKIEKQMVKNSVYCVLAHYIILS